MAQATHAAAYSRDPRARTASMGHVMATLPAVAIMATAMSPTVQGAVANYLEVARMGGPAVAGGLGLAVAAGAISTVLVDVQRAARTWMGSKSFSSMVKSFVGTKGMDPRVETDVRRFTTGHGKDPLHISLDRLVRQSAFSSPATTQAWVMSPDGEVGRIRTRRDYASVFGDRDPPVRLSIREVADPEPLADGTGMAWSGHVEVVATALGAEKGRWLLDREGRLLQGTGQWAVASSTDPERVDETEYTPLVAPDPHVAFTPWGR